MLSELGSFVGLIGRSLVKRLRVLRADVVLAAGSEKYCTPALNRLDQLIQPYLPDEGYFLEIGANDGYNQSNSFYLERVRRWRGILIEPVPRLFAVCERVRRRSDCFNVACVAGDRVGFVAIDDTDLTSSLSNVPSVDRGKERPKSGKVLKVPAVTLSQVINASSVPHVDFMSIDVEGAELEVLAGLELRDFPKVLLVETLDPTSIDEVLGPAMTRVARLTHHDYVWLRAD